MFTRVTMASKRALTVLVDMDGVLADFEAHWLNVFRQRFPEKKYIPLEDRRTFYIDDQYDEEESDIVNEIMAEDGFYMALEPIEGAIEALKEMSSLKDVRVSICSSPLVTNYESCSSEKGAWIAEHLGRDWLRRFILTTDKTMVRADVLIDDKHRVTGSMKPVWEHVVFTACHNRHINLKGRKRLESWKTSDWMELIQYYQKKCLS